jgi:ribosomal protein S18 acetylase RimI-like enzyme
MFGVSHREVMRRVRSTAGQTPRYNGGVPFTVRDFQPTEFDTLWRIDRDCFPAGISYSRSELRFYMRRRGSFTLVAADEAKTAVAGFIVAEADRGSGHIITIDVIASARRSGVGSLLLSATEDRLSTAHCGSVELETAVDNVSALSFYKRHGYSVIKTFPRYYSNGVDALVLEKSLEPTR